MSMTAENDTPAGAAGDPVGVEIETAAEALHAHLNATSPYTWAEIAASKPETAAHFRGIARVALATRPASPAPATSAGGEGAKHHRIRLPEPTKDQREYLETVQATSGSYDPNRLIRGHNPDAASAECGPYDPVRGWMAEGCRSSISPCSHQQRDWHTICAHCDDRREPAALAPAAQVNPGREEIALRPMSSAPHGVPILAKHKPNACMPWGWYATIRLGNGDDESEDCYDDILHYNGDYLVSNFHGCWEGWLPVRADAILAARPGAEGDADWQPIETAPKGGSMLVTAEHNGETIVAEALRFSSGTFGLASFNGTMPRCKPTHWRPLPAPPAPLLDRITAAEGDAGETR